MQYINELLAVITRHPTLAYGTVFMISLSESLALVGLIVPGTMIMFSIGAVVAMGSLGLKPVLLLAAAGAVMGDGISYWLGRHYHGELRRVWPFSRYPGMLENGEHFFHRHGGKSVLFGRFVGPIRPIIPVVAGMLGMKPLHFGVVNVLSAIGWALVYILPGVFFGTSLAVAGAVSARLAVLALLLLAGIWGFIWLGRKLVLLVNRQGPILLAGLKRWISSETPAHCGAGPVKKILSLFFLRQQGEEWLFGFLVLVLFAAGWGFLAVLQDVLAKDPLVLADQAVYHFFLSLRNPWADSLFVAITEVGDSFVPVCLFVAVLAVLLGKHCYRTAGFWAVTVAGGLAGVQLLKWGIHLPRPVAIYNGASAFGFPSGHTTMTVILYGFLAILLVRRISGNLRWGIFITALLISFVIAVSRLYLGAHWLSDVLGGFFIGTSWTVLMGIAYLKKSTEKLPRRLLGAVIILVVVISGGWHVNQNHKKDMELYASRPRMDAMSLAAWHTHGWRDLSAWQIDMIGEREQPLTLQWAGSPDTLARHLVNMGWHWPFPVDIKQFLGILSPRTPIEALPVFPRLHSGRVDCLRLIYRNKDLRWVLRLWPSDLKIEPENLPVFVGTIEVQRLGHLGGLITTAMDTRAYDFSLAEIQKMLRDSVFIKPVSRTAREILVDHDPPGIHWQGRVLLLWEKDLP